MRQLLLLALVGLLLAGCRKADLVTCGPTPAAPTATVPPAPTAGSTSNISLSGFFNKYGAPLQRLGFIIGQSQPIRTASGAALSVAGVRFLYDSNTPAQDSAYLYLREVYTVPQMLLSDLPTNSQDDQLLISGGEFQVQVRAASGRRLRAATGPGVASLPVWQSRVPPEQDTTAQQFWQMPYAGAGWQRTSGVAVQTVQQPTLVQGPAYQTSMLLDSLPYSNIDQLWHYYLGAPTLAVITVDAPTTAANETRVLLRPVGFNGLYRLRANSASGNTTRWTAQLPVGATFKLAVLQSVNGQLYFGTQPLTVAATTPAIAPALAPVSEADALALINAL